MSDKHAEPTTRELLLDVLTRLARLEDRLERDGVLRDDTHGDNVLRFVLENGLPTSLLDDLPREPLGRREWISREFHDRVYAWMEANEDDPTATFTKLARELSKDCGTGKEIRAELCVILEYFARTGQWLTALAHVTSDAHPARLKAIRQLLALE